MVGQVALARVLSFVAIAALGGTLLIGAPGVRLHHRYAGGLVADGVLREFKRATKTPRG